METPGTILKAEREKQQRSLEEIAEDLKLNIEYLRAIENGNYSNIPAEIYTRAYLRFYSEALGVDSGHIIDLYQKMASVPQGQKLPAAEERPVEEHPAGTSPRKYAYSVIAFAIVIVLTAAYILKQKRPDSELPRDTITQDKQETVNKAATPVPLQDNKTTDPAAENGPQKKEEATLPREQPVVQGSGQMTLDISAADTVWIIVTPDGSEPKEWLLKKGEKISLTAEKKFVIRTGNAGGTTLIYNGKDIGPLGQSGQVVDVILPQNTEAQRP